MSNFQLFYSDQVGGGSPTGQDPENRVGGQDIRCLGCKCQGIRCNVVQEQNPLVNFPRGFPFRLSLSCISRDE